MSDDPLIAQHEDAEIDAQRARKAATLFDLRRMIGGLFLLYGVILFVLGLGASDAEIEKAAGWNLNLWVGVAMFAFGALFVAWSLLLPLSDEIADEEPQEDDRTVKGAHAPTGPDAAALGGSKTTRRTSRRDRGRSGH
jgi:hypothetical protein